MLKVLKQQWNISWANHTHQGFIRTEGAPWDFSPPGKLVHGPRHVPECSHARPLINVIYWWPKPTMETISEHQIKISGWGIPPDGPPGSWSSMLGLPYIVPMN